MRLLFGFLLFSLLPFAAGAQSQLPECSSATFRHDCFDTQIFPNGAKYVGEFKGDKRNGQGIAYTSSGAISMQGRWENGSLVQSFSIDAKFFPFTSPIVRAVTSNQSTNQSTAEQILTSASIPEAKIKCADIGFTPGTEGFGKCVLQLSK